MSDLKTPPQPVAVMSPITKEIKQKAILRNWTHYPAGGGRFDRDFNHLEGNVYGHPDPWLPDGEYIATSMVLWIDLSLRVAETRNTVYILEGPPA